jgi:DNA-binding response OmpR family regulator
MLPEADQLATVVVCEDDEATLELLCDHLTADRYRALAAPSASDALRLCHFKQPDLLLLDLRLPDASGLDVLREIRATDGSNGRFDPSLPVVVLSGRASPSDRVRGLAAGADDYLTKPFHYEELVWRLRAVLRRRAQRRQGPRRIGDLSSIHRPGRWRCPGGAWSCRTGSSDV